jgi:hypothetical protein
MLAPLLLAAAFIEMAPTPPRDHAGPALRIENGRIVQAWRPPFGSGIFAVYADFDVAVPGGSQQRMYLLWAGEPQFLPDASSVCTITYRREALLPGNVHRPVRVGRHEQGPVNLVHQLDCGFGRGAPPPAQRGSPSAR